MWSKSLRGSTALITVILVVFKLMSKEEFGYTVTETILGACSEKTAHLSTRSMADLYNKTSRPLQGFVNKSLLVPPLVNFEEIFRVSPKFNLATCHIEKIMCTFRAGMFCYLNRRREFVKEGRSISTERWSTMLCKEGRAHRNTFEETIRSLSKQPIIFNVIRHPIDRFLSGFTDKCIRQKVCSSCFHCSNNLECFITKLHENLVAYYTKSRTLTEIEHFCVQHFAPANWYCNLKKSYDKMLFMRYNRCNRNELAEDFVAVLSKALVPHTQTNYIRKEVLSQLPKHATSNGEERKQVERKLLTRPHLLRLLLHIYYYDFIIFDYSFLEGIDCHVAVEGNETLQTIINTTFPNRKLSRVGSIWYLLRAQLLELLDDF